MLDYTDVQGEWRALIGSVSQRPFWQVLDEFVEAERAQFEVFPKRADVFRALIETPLPNANVVIVGQDPYHGTGQAHGLAFSVENGVAIPPSLRNILKEAREDIGARTGSSGNLTAWARQGVLLMNSVLTVRACEPASHRKRGWETFSDELLRLLSDQNRPIVFVLWGNHAKEKQRLIDQGRHLVIEAPHPSPLSASRGFFGSRPFSKINAYLIKTGRTPIDWDLSNE